MNCDRLSVTSPSAKTPIVCVIVTVPPSRNACRAVPFEPTRYAVMIDFPWPGLSACAAPQKNAIASAAARNHPLGRRRISFANPESATARTARSEEHTSELQSRSDLVCRLLLEKKKRNLPDWLPSCIIVLHIL